MRKLGRNSYQITDVGGLVRMENRNKKSKFD